MLHTVIAFLCKIYLMLCAQAILMKNVTQMLCPEKQFSEILSHVTQSSFAKPKNFFACD